MSMEFAETLKKLRAEKGLSQQQLADLVFVNRTTITNWESGRRIPDAIMINRLAECLGVDVGFLLGSTMAEHEPPEVIVADDERLILSSTISLLEETLPHASIAGFRNGKEVLEYARSTNVSLAFLDIEMGIPSGLELCKKLLEINPKTNVVFLTAHQEYALEAWGTGACGFLRKPLSKEDVLNQISRLRHPISGLL